MRQRLYGALDHPWVYRLSQSIPGPGGQGAIIDVIEKLIHQLPPAGLLLDVGCGPSSWLLHAGLCPVGLDLSWSYLREYTRRGASAVVGFADKLPFPAYSFDGVWSIGLVHHLPDHAAEAAIRELMRVCSLGGYVVVVDSVLPRSAWQRPVATAIRRLDRGEFLRSQGEFESLLPLRDSWSIQRFTYGVIGLEGLACWLVRS